MPTLGISYGFHDATAALVDGGQVLAAAAEERFTRQKHDANFPAFAIQHCLDAADLSLDDVDFIAYHENPSQTFTRVVASSLAGFPHTRREFGAAMKAWFGKKLWVENDIAKRLNVAPERIRFSNHHQSHAAQAFLGSGFEESAILTIDAVGEWATSTLARGERAAATAPKIETLQTVEYPHSLGLVYSAFTAWLGFVPMDSECSTMALAAFGAPRFAAEIRKIIAVDANGGFRVDQSYFNFDRYFSQPVSDLFVSVFGPPRDSRQPLPFDCLVAGRAATDSGSQHFADVAASIQLVFEEALLSMARALKRRTGSKNLCFAGGSALNCVANARLLASGLFDSIYVPPDPGDGGAAVGAALLIDAESGPVPASRYGVYLGPNPSFGGGAQDDGFEAMLGHVEPKNFRRHVKAGVTIAANSAWDKQKFLSDEDLIEAVAARLAAGDVVGWVQGRAESGPRALGARSLLFRPDDLDIARRVGTLIKDRARYRPYALSMTQNAAQSLLAPERAEHLNSSLFRWMQAACGVRDAARSAVKAGLHVDGTTRPQIVCRATTPLFHSLLEAVGRVTGTEALVNTSFNESGFPLVTTPMEALAVFARTDLDTLVTGNLMITKRRGGPWPSHTR